MWLESKAFSIGTHAVEAKGLMYCGVDRCSRQRWLSFLPFFLTCGKRKGNGERDIHLVTMYWGSRKGRLEDGGLVNKNIPKLLGSQLNRHCYQPSFLSFCICQSKDISFFICAWSEIDENLQNYFPYLLNFYLVLASSLLLIPKYKKTGVIFPGLKPVFIFQVIFRKLYCSIFTSQSETFFLELPKTLYP